MILLISDRPQEWAVGFLLKNLLYAKLLNCPVIDHVTAESYYISHLIDYVAHGIELERTQIIQD